MKNVIVGFEESQAVTIELRKKGIRAFSCDLKPCSGGHPEWHLQADIFSVMNGGLLATEFGNGVFVYKWHAGIFFPDCTYLTNSAAWAYKEPPYHQNLKAGTLFGKDRIEARKQALNTVNRLWNDYGLENISIENPIGVLSSLFMKPTQIIHPYMFGDNASKSTCLWLKGFTALTPTEYIQPRLVNGLKRWGNQTDSGQNKLPPSKNRSELRSKTYAGIAQAIADQWF